jgi:hypothetical protein
MRLITRGILFIQEPTRCIKLWRRTSSGHEWSERLQSMCPNVTHVEESKPIIWDPLKIYNPWAFLSGNGKTYVWTSLWVCPRTSRGYNSIWVIVDHLTKSAHFIPIATTYRVRQYAELYLSHIIHYHGIPKTIISDRWSIFVARFWKQLHECLGTHLIRSSACHPQIDGHTERVNKVIEDMLHACVLTDGPK